MTAIASRVTERNVAVFYQQLKRIGSPAIRLGDRVLAATVHRAAEPSDVVHLLTNAVAGGDQLTDARATIHAVTRLVRPPAFALWVAVGLIEAGTPEPANILIRLATRPGAASARFQRALQELDIRAHETLFAFIAGLEDVEVICYFADMLRSGGADDRPLDQLLDKLTSRGTLGALSSKDDAGNYLTSKQLRRYANQRYR